MKIWLIQIGEPIPFSNAVRRQRLSLLCESLASRGHQVIRWGSAFDHITKKMLSESHTDVQIAPNYIVKLIKGLGYKKNISFRRWFDHLIIENKIINIAETLDSPDVILVATPPHSLAYKVVRFAKKKRIPVIVDIRDQWPDIFVERLPKKLQKIGKYIFAYEFLKLRRALSAADSVTAMMEELLLWGLNSAHRVRSNQDKVFYIGTHVAETVDLQTVRTDLQSIINELTGKVVVTFVGTFNNFYNPSIIVEVAKLFKEERRNDIVFVLAGSGGCYEEVKKKAEGLSNVVMTGWLQHQEIMGLLKVSDIGICPLNEERPCFPNKVFIYLSAHLPVISSTPGDFERLINKYRLGIYYKPGDTKGLYNAVAALVNKELRMEMRKNVELQFRERFDAARIYLDFANHVEEIAHYRG
jgi:glycosyltransferase involved in cell wall biosynthesis